MTGVLRVVATPIGNLQDLSPRAAEALRTSALVLAEDTRRARILVDHVGSAAKLVSCHQHNEPERAAVAIERLRAGDDVAFVSDAGAPSVSDPGGRLVDAVAHAGLPVEVVPGPSALVAALMGAGLAAPRFAFVGFLPRRSGARRAVLSRVDPSFGVVLFEAPGRVESTLSDLHEVLGPRRLVVARELTKRFETFHRGVLGGELSPPLVEKGEVVIVVEAGAEGEAAPRPPSAAERAAQVETLAHDATLRPRDKAKAIAKALGISTKEAYDVVSGKAPPPAREPGAERLAPETAAPSDLDDASQRIHGAIERSRAARRRLLDALGDAAHALVEADAAAAEARGHERPERPRPPVGSDVEGVDALLRLLEEPPGLPAPVETVETARAILAALSAADALEDALGFVAEDGAPSEEG